MWPNLQGTADLVTFIEEIFNWKLHFLSNGASWGNRLVFTTRSASWLCLCLGSYVCALKKTSHFIRIYRNFSGLFCFWLRSEWRISTYLVCNWPYQDLFGEILTYMYYMQQHDHVDLPFMDFNERFFQILSFSQKCV